MLHQYTQLESLLCGSSGRLLIPGSTVNAERCGGHSFKDQHSPSLGSASPLQKWRCG